MMIELNTLLIFLTACLAVNISPGPSIIYVSTMAIAQGSREGILSALGLSLGILVHVFAAALGASTILATSALAFTIVKYVGAAYLVYLGLKIVFSRTKSLEAEHRPANRGPLKTLLRGALVDLLNPKITVFFLAFLPQFVVPDSGNSFGQIVFLGIIFILSGTIVNIAIAVLASRTARRVERSKHLWVTRWLPGCILVGLGARLATLER